MQDGLGISLNTSGESQMPTRQEAETFVIQGNSPSIKNLSGSPSNAKHIYVNDLALGNDL